MSIASRAQLFGGMDSVEDRMAEGLAVGGGAFTRWQPWLRASRLPRLGGVMMQAYLDHYNAWIPSTRYTSGYVRSVYYRCITNVIRLIN
jgi:hypothetical protein